MKRVLYVEANEDGTVGGSHKVLFDLVTRVSSEFDPVVLFYEDNIWVERFRSKQIETVVWEDVRRTERRGLKSGTKLSTVIALGRAVRTRQKFLRELGIDLVHLNNSPFIGFDDWLPASKLAGVPCAVYAMGEAKRASNPLVRSALCMFDAYFPVSGFVRESLLQNGIDPDLVTLAYPGIDFGESDKREFRSAVDVRREFGFSEEQLLVAMVGNVRTWKGQDVVLQALAGLDRPDLDRLKVLFVGHRGHQDAPYQNKLEALIDTHDLGSAVVFTGRREDVPDLLEAADIAVHASVTPEPFGLVVQEAMLHGCATIAANKGGPTEMITADSGFLFDADDPSQLTMHLENLIGDSDLRIQVSKRARERVRVFDVGEHVSRVENRYRDILGLD